MNHPAQWNQKPKSTRAQGMVEFAMALPILLMLIFGIIEFGRLLFTYSAVISAAREAARYGAAGGKIDPNDLLSVNYFRDCDGIRAAAVRIGVYAGVGNNAQDIDIQYDNGPDPTDPKQIIDNIPQGCPVGGTGPNVRPGDRIVVTVTAHFHPAQGIVVLPTLDISSTVRRSVIIQVPIAPDSRTIP